MSRKRGFNTSSMEKFSNKLLKSIKPSMTKWNMKLCKKFREKNILLSTLKISSSLDKYLKGNALENIKLRFIPCEREKKGVVNKKSYFNGIPQKYFCPLYGDLIENTIISFVGNALKMS